jgi:hypothetical protein
VDVLSAAEAGAKHGGPQTRSWQGDQLSSTESSTGHEIRLLAQLTESEHALVATLNQR